MSAIYSKFSRKRFAVILWALLFLLCYNNQSFAQKTGKTISKPSGFNSWTPSHLLPSANSFYGLDNPGPDTVVRTDFTVTLRDGVIIDCLKYVPLRATPPVGGYFTVIMVHGYGDNKNTLATFCHDQASYGYYTMTYSVRGQGLSGGLSNLISDVEALDLLEIIQWVKNDSLNGSNPGKILIMGGSQGGLLPMKAICMVGRPVTTIISALAPPNFASSWIENGTIKMTALWTMDYTSDTARYTQQVINMRNWIEADTKPLWDSLNRTLPIGRDFVTSLHNCQTPVFVEGSWQDKFFNASGWLDNITQLTVPMTSYFGAVQGHGGDHSATEDTWHENWFNNWFFQWLWDMNTGILTAPKYQYAYTTFPVVGQYWSFVHDSSTVPLNNISTNLRLYFNENQKLLSTYNSNNSNKASFKNQVGTNYTLTQAIDDEFKGTTFNNKFKVDSAIFTSTALTAPLKWVGTPTIKLDYSSSASTFCQFNLEIYEVQANGTRRFVDRANFTDRNYVANSRRTATFKGQSHAHMFQQGSKIRIKITNLDRVKEDTAFFGATNPFVLPVMKNGTHNVFLSNNCYIDFPVVNPVAHPFHMYMNGGSEETTTTNEPIQFKLTQNYPNPFNPSTMIEYSVANTQKVELKVYDVLGREVATLVNQVQNPGSYNVMFNASSLSSGIYFYKLVSGSFTDIKKMVLVK